VWFPEVAEGFEELLDHCIKLEALYDGSLAEEMDYLATRLSKEDPHKLPEPFFLDIEGLEELSIKPVSSSCLPAGYDSGRGFGHHWGESPGAGVAGPACLTALPYSKSD
jgi:hypothetical protein